MKHVLSLTLAFTLASASMASAREALLVRYPHYHAGKVTFTYLGDIWTANEDGTNIQRLTVHKGRDYNSRFSPDGKWIAFSSDRNGNDDVFIMPAAGGQARQLTTHSAGEKVLNWTPDSKGVLFSTQRGEDFMGKLYVVSIDGGMPRNAGPDMGVDGSYSPDGTKLAINRKAQSYWRKYYRGSYQTDVTIMDVAAKKFTDVTDFDGLDSWPLYGTDGFVYFVSDRDGKGLTNIWRVSEKGGPAEKVTDFTSGDVRFPAISADGKTIVFEHDFRISKLDVPSKKVIPLKFDINAETQETLVEWRDFASTVDDFDASPDGKRIAFSIHGEIFTAPTDEGDLIQITDSADRDKDVDYSPDGKLLAYVTDTDGREEIYVVPVDATAPPRKLTAVDALKQGYEWSPDSKWILFTTSDGKLIKVSADGKEQKELATSKFGGFQGAHWAPDSKWIVYSRPDVTRMTDIYLLPANGGEEKKLTFEASSESNPRFSADGKKVYFIRREGDFGEAAAGRASSHIYVIYLEKQDHDPTEAAPADAAEAGADGARRMGGPGAGGRGPGAPVTAAKEVKIDWAGLKRRTKQVTPTTLSVFGYLPAVDGKTLVFFGSEGGGGGLGRGGAAAGAAPGGGGRSIYSIQDDGKRLTRVSSGADVTESTAGDGPRGLRGRFGGGGGGGLILTRDGRTIFFEEGGSVYSAPMGGTPVATSETPAGAPAGRGGGGGGAGRGAALLGGGTGGGGGARKRITFDAKVRIEKSAEWAEMFGDAWRTMKYRFYDPKMHGYDWDAMKAKYSPLVAYVGDSHELMNVINEMIGELNASHTGAAAGGGGGGGRGRGGAGGDSSNVSTGHPGFDLDADSASGRYRVTHVYEGGPADADWIKVSKGDYLISINGKPIKVGDDYFELLNNRRLNRKVAFALNSKPSPEGAWTVKLEPITSQAFSALRYRRWVNDRKEMTEKLSGGRVGYLHIQAMDQPSLQKFERELRELRHKEGLVIDQRFNGGGNIEQELLALLVQKQYQVWQPRGTEATTRPLNGFFGPKVVMQNWRSASNAEMFPAGFRALGLGKVIGTPTMGAVIGTGSYSLIDGSTVRTPGVGVYLNDATRTNMENYGVKPDIFVENSPEDNLAGFDRQLDVAVREVMKDLRASGSVAGK
jgi:tricorn protease